MLRSTIETYISTRRLFVMKQQKIPANRVCQVHISDLHESRREILLRANDIGTRSVVTSYQCLCQRFICSESSPRHSKSFVYARSPLSQKNSSRAAHVQIFFLLKFKRYIVFIPGDYVSKRRDFEIYEFFHRQLCSFFRFPAIPWVPEL